MADIHDLGTRQAATGLKMTQRLASMLQAAKPRRRAQNGQRSRIWKLLRRAQAPVSPTTALPPHPLSVPALPAKSLSAEALPLSSQEIALAVMAINRLGPASFRAATSGKPVKLAAPDPRTADLFRAALAVTQRNRSTDRLIEVVVEEDRSAA